MNKLLVALALITVEFSAATMLAMALATPPALIPYGLDQRPSWRGTLTFGQPDRLLFWCGTSEGVSPSRVLQIGCPSPRLLGLADGLRNRFASELGSIQEKALGPIADDGESNVRFGSLADVLTSSRHDRFTPNNRRWAAHPSQHLRWSLHLDEGVFIIANRLRAKDAARERFRSCRESYAAL
jgi:hypothetical protein